MPLGRAAVYCSGRRAFLALAINFRTSGSTLIPVLAVLVASTLAGCHAPPQASGPAEIVLRLTDRDCFIDNVLTVLRRYDLPAERVDRDCGLIVSRRTTSGQWFECWRVDSQGAYQNLESSLGTIGRTVTVEIMPAEPPAQVISPLEPEAPPIAADPAPLAMAEEDTPAKCGDYRVSVCVAKERLSVPERQVTTASGALALFNVRTPTVAGEFTARSAAIDWIAIGRDPLLEAYLLAKFVDAAPDAEIADPALGG